MAIFNAYDDSYGWSADQAPGNDVFAPTTTPPTSASSSPNPSAPPTSSPGPSQSAKLDTPTANAWQAPNVWAPAVPGQTQTITNGAVAPRAGAAPTAPGSLSGAFSDDQLRQWLSSYYTSKGHTPDAGIETWVGYWNQWGKNDPAYFQLRLDQGLNGTTPQESPQQQPFASPQMAPPQQVGGGSTFSDPATTEWETALRGLVDKLNQPQSVPDLTPLTDYLRSYFQQLQGPAYTPNDMDLIQTQSLDPMTQQRDAQRQQIIERASRRGLDPKSGIVESELRDLDNRYSQLRTQTQSKFAANAVGLQQQRQQQAGQVGTALATIEQQKSAQDEARALQGVNLLFQIPQLADTRLGLANGVLNQGAVNPASLLSSLNGFQNTSLTASNQDQQYWATLISQIAPALINLIPHNP